MKPHLPLLALEKGELIPNTLHALYKNTECSRRNGDIEHLECG